jgi:hypothetical protein
MIMLSAIQYEVLNWKKALEANGNFSIKNIGDISLCRQQYCLQTFRPDELFVLSGLR